MYYEIQVSLNNDTVWVHSSDGSTVGRFGRFGIDIHNTVSEQMQGKSECRLCTHGRVSLPDWKLFIEKSLTFWGVVIPENSFNHDLLK